VYVAASERAGAIVRSGHAAIVDAVFSRPTDRAAIEAAAAEAAVPFVGIWLDAPLDVLIARAEMRRLDPSDADAEVVRAQVSADTGAIGWHRVDSTSDVAQIEERVRQLLDEKIRPD
jgi:predicted kinase